MNKYIGYMLMLLTLSFGFTGCEDEATDSTQPTPTIAFATSMLKTMENVTPLQIPVTLNVPAPADVKVTVAVKSENGAVENQHYKFQQKEITISKGATIGYFFVDIIDDRDINPDRTFTIEIKQVNGAALAEGGESCMVVIQSDEGLPVLGFHKTLISTPEETPTLEVAVVTNKPYNLPVTFRVTIPEDGTAVRGEDYTVDVDREFTIPAGDTVVYIPVTIIDNDLVNENKIFTFRLTGATNATISEIYQESKITIINDEQYAYVSFSTTMTDVFESDGYVYIPMKVEGVYKLPIKVSLAVEDVTAKSGTDYVFETQTLEFTDSKMEDSLRIKIIDNEEMNVDKSFRVIIDQVEGALKAEKDTIMTVNILNDEVNIKNLYDNILGDYQFTCTDLGNMGQGVVTVTAGDNLGEENENYMKRVKCTGNLAQGSYKITWYMDFNPETGELSLTTDQLVTQHIGFGTVQGIDMSDADIRFWLEENESYVKKTITTSWNKNCTVCTWNIPDGGIWGGIHQPGNTTPPPYTPDLAFVWFGFKDAVMTRIK